jgi:aminocarboxymuconate-semialdehyde decarboxylase
MVGTDKVLLGSDYPFPIGDLEPLNILRKAGLNDATVKAITETNPAKMFNVV